MEYLSVQEIKKQCLIDADFDEDDDYLELIGDAAESLVNEHLDFKLDEIVARSGGSLPSTLRAAMLLFCAYLYDNRGSQDADFPKAVSILVRPYINYPIK